LGILESIQTAPFQQDIAIRNAEMYHLSLVIIRLSYPGTGSVSATDENSALVVAFLGQNV